MNATLGAAVQDTDYQLIERWRTGDQLAFEQLFERHYAQVYRVAYGFVRVHDEAEDLAQETFLALYKQPPQLTPQATLIAWLCRVATNKGYNQLRGLQRERTRMFTQLPSSVSSEPFEHMLLTEEWAQVRVALAKLPERQAALLSLRASGMAYAEIAATLGVAVGSVGTLLARAERAFLQMYMSIDQSDAVQAA